ncbi:hypothetical protein RHGRI_002908 [Rhododendron griersonianum]|uniref:Uncharacterized protein n=1 Tax=Rhododendron griersonianum TaxID=479676 RepID=A0AAV6LQW2_9ERIC|nr:hypothetical protein RHGRI_002908 [Rhododendron griersonianum]KAG5567523.1 hypothetical protein RHGRI_002908 [Rhododendron griersonianum]
MSTACGLESVNWFMSKPKMLWNSSPEKGGGIACRKSAIIRVIEHNWMLQGSFNSIFSPANICYGGDGIRTWNEEAVSRCALFSSQVSQYTTDGLEQARDSLTEAATPFATIAQTSFREHALAGVALACEEADPLCI